MVEVILSVLAAVMPSARVWPQVIRIIRRNTVSGVSVLSWTLILANFTIWNMYGVFEHLPVVIGANAAAGVGACCVLLGLARHHVSSFARPILTIAGTVVASLLINAVGGDTTVLVCATALAICMFIPQVVTAFRQPPTGISPTTWWLGIAAGFIWFGYGWSVDHLQIAAPHAVMVPCAVAILWRIYTFKPILRTESVTTAFENA